MKTENKGEKALEADIWLVLAETEWKPRCLIYENEEWRLKETAENLN